MCSVPGVPIAGSQVSVVVSRVELNQSAGLLELWVTLHQDTHQVCDQKHQDTSHVYEKMHQDIQLPKRVFCGPEGQRGDLCLANVDERWHRARIVSVHDQHYQVFLIDTGRPHRAACRELAWGRDECFILPPEVECCILANVVCAENWPERALNFLRSLPGKEFHGLVLHALMPERNILLDLPMISKHLCKEGVAKKILTSDFKDLVLKSLSLPREEPVTSREEQSSHLCRQLDDECSFFCPELSLNTYAAVRVTEAVHPGLLFCELLVFSKAFCLLSDQMNLELNAEASASESRPRAARTACAALGGDGRWRRAILNHNVRSEDATVEVFFVDEGKTEVIQAANIKDLEPKFLRMPVATYRCSLAGICDAWQWEQKDLDKLKSHTLHHELVGRFECHLLPEDRYTVRLYTDDACINDYFTDKTEATDQTDARPSFPHNRFQNYDAVNCSYSPKGLPQNTAPDSNVPLDTPFCDSLKVGANVNVNISSIDTANRFWCQRSDRNELDVLMSKLQVHYASAPPAPLLEHICVARNPDNNTWYRARVSANQPPSEVHVTFIDFGISKTLSLWELHPIDPTFLRLGAQAFPCALANLPPADVSCANQEFRMFVESAQSDGLQCVVKAVEADEEGGVLSVVELQTQTGGTSRVLAEKLAGKPSAFHHSHHRIQRNLKEKIRVTHSETVHCFYAQLDRNTQLLERVQSDIEKRIHESSAMISSFAVGDLCVARHTNSRWQRGQVVETFPQLKVHFVDFGEMLIVNQVDIQLFPQDAVAARILPVLAIPLALYDIPNTVPPEINDWFSAKVVGNMFTMSVEGSGQQGALCQESGLQVALCQGLDSVNAQVKEKIIDFNKTSSASNVVEQLSITEKPVMSQSLMEAHVDKNSVEITDTEMTEYAPDKPSPAETAPDKPSPAETAPDKPSPAETAPDKPSPAESTPDKPSPAPNLAYKTRLVTAQRQLLYASSITSPDYFWCQSSDADDLDQVTELAQVEGHAVQDPLFPLQLRPHQPCLALYKSDQQWYRAQVVCKNQSTFTVVFVDFGNEEDVRYEDVRPLSAELLAVAPQALLFHLDGAEETQQHWDEAFYNAFVSLIEGRALSITVLDVTHHPETQLPQYTVQIHDDAVHELMQRFEANESKAKTQRDGGSTVLYSSPNALLNKRLAVFVTFNSGPAHFWCQHKDSDKLNKIKEICKEGGWVEDPSFANSLSPGSPCLALDLKDNTWYRAQVISKEKDQVSVVFVDYGKETDIQSKNVRQIPTSLMTVQPQAFLCRFENCDEKTQWLSDEMCTRFVSALAERLHEARAVSVEHNEKFRVPQYVIKDDTGLFETLKSKFCQQQSDGSDKKNNEIKGTQPRASFMSVQIQKNCTIAAYATCVSGPDFFWCQLCDDAELDKVHKQAQVEGEVPLDMDFCNALVPGDPCLALFSDDHTWYRAQILSKSIKLKAVFIDYGNEDDVGFQDVRPISAALLSVPPRAFFCLLNGFKSQNHNGSWDQNADQFFHDLIVDRLLKVTPVRKFPNTETLLPQYAVELEVGTASVNLQMLTFWKNGASKNVPHSETTAVPEEQSVPAKAAEPVVPIRPVPFKSPDVTLYQTVLVHASCIVDPHFFWCQFDSGEEEQRLLKLAEECSHTQPVPTTLDKGAACLALFPEDQRWYRALVQAKTLHHSFHIVFIDYGNEAVDVTMRDTRVLTQSLLEAHPLAFLCALSGFDRLRGRWDDGTDESFYHLLLDQQLKVKIVDQETNAELGLPQYKVEVESEGGCDINQCMRQFWKESADQTLKRKYQDFESATMTETE